MNKFKNQEVAIIADGTLSEKILTLLKSYKSLVVCDNGLAFCDAHALKPDLIIGDFDTVSPKLLEKYSGVTQIHDRDTETTDLEKALNHLHPFNPKKIAVFGAIGKRIDHTLTNICLLTRFPRAVFETEIETLSLVDKTLTLNCTPGQTISLIPLHGKVTGITTQGLKWELKNSTLSKNFVGISNVALQKMVVIECDKGDLLVSINRLC